MLDTTDRTIIHRLCGDIGDSVAPFAALAEELGIPEEDLLTRLLSYRERGMMRRFGAILRHGLAGFNANGMSVWDVPDDQAECVGGIMASFDEVSHCYQRPRLPDWPYNLYGMIHGRTPDDCLAAVGRIAEATGIHDYRVLFTLREFKKTSMVYCSDTD